ncbi:SpvB/TcaC N-terminal domain-containing protein [Aliikangiella maris]|uniref:SpvB/TcaC N-terminal domain-containing protein n=1 Tax=Aliikangiella maris TaxID=3162458 RepID=A0ABV2BZ63_9GAMM
MWLLLKTVASSSGALIQSLASGYLNVDWSAQSYVASIENGGIQLNYIGNSAENNFAETNSNGVVTHLQIPVTKPIINGTPPRFIYEGESFLFQPELSIQNVDLSLSGHPSWMYVNNELNELIGEVITYANETYSVRIDVNEIKSSHTVPVNFTFRLDVIKGFTIPQEDYEVYLAANGDIYLKSKSSATFFKVKVEGQLYWILQITQAEFDAANAVLNTDYRIEYLDVEGDDKIDLVIYPRTGVELSSYAISAIEDTSHTIDVGGPAEFVVPDAAFIAPTVPLNEIVGSVPASAGVSGSAASYAIPISIPPGRNNMQPKVALNYSSRSGNGIAGVGWSLSAGSGISRCGATYAQDGFTAGISFNDQTDKLCIDGMRLKLVSGTYGASGAVYRTELDNFEKVTQTGAINGTSTTFTVENFSGLIRYYGVSTGGYGAQVVPVGQTKTLSWLISHESTHAGNNTIHYEYSSTKDSEIVLNTIYYTGTSSSAGNRKVEFTYRDDRPVKRVNYLGGGKLKQTKLLSKITSYYDNSQVSEYSLNYSTDIDDTDITPSAASGRALLRSIKMCGEDSSNCYEPTVFDWLENKTAYELEVLKTSDGVEISEATTYLSSVLPHGDINGDGVRDWSNYFINAEGDKVDHNFTLNTCKYDRVVFKRRLCLDADFDLNGTTDMWTVENEKLVLKLTSSSNGSVSSTEVITDIPMNQGGDNLYDFIIHAADFNGDGWADLLISRYENLQLHIYYYPNQRSKTNPYLESTKQKIYNYSKPHGAPSDVNIQFAGDIDGNGLPDLVIYYQSPDYVNAYPKEILLTQTTSTEAGLSFTAKNIDYYAGEFSQFAMFFDVNSDGFDDLIGWDGTKDIKEDDSALNVLARINQGNGNFGEPVNLGNLFTKRTYKIQITGEYHDWKYQYAPKYQDAIKVMDVNGDGRSELILPGSELIKGCARVQHKGEPQWFCGDSIYSDTENYTVDGWVTAPISSNFDYSIYQYAAFSFDENASGNITVSSSATGLIGAANHSMVVDSFGKGLPDLAFSYGCVFSSSCKLKIPETNPLPSGIVPGKVYFNRNYGSATDSTLNKTSYRPRDMLIRSTEAMGKISEWDYLPLSSGQQPANALDKTFDIYQTIYDNPLNYVGGQFAFASSMYVVSEFRQSNGLGSLNNTNYQYRDAVYNAVGRGFQGFGRIIVDSPSQLDANGNIAEGVRSVTNFRQVFPLTSRPLTIRRCLVKIDDDTCDDSILGGNRLFYESYKYTTMTTDINSRP